MQWHTETSGAQKAILLAAANLHYTVASAVFRPSGSGDDYRRWLLPMAVAALRQQALATAAAPAPIPLEFSPRVGNSIQTAAVSSNVSRRHALASAAACCSQQDRLIFALINCGSWLTLNQNKNEGPSTDKCKWLAYRRQCVRRGIRSKGRNVFRNWGNEPARPDRESEE